MMKIGDLPLESTGIFQGGALVISANIIKESGRFAKRRSEF